MKIAFECPRCVSHFEKDESVLNRYTFLDRSFIYSVRCPKCFYEFEVTQNYICNQTDAKLDKLSKRED